jgi:hypothetical protein
MGTKLINLDGYTQESIFLIELIERLVRLASMPLLSFRRLHIGFGGFHQHLMSPNLS